MDINYFVMYNHNINRKEVNTMEKKAENIERYIEMLKNDPSSCEDSIIEAEKTAAMLRSMADAKTGGNVSSSAPVMNSENDRNRKFFNAVMAVFTLFVSGICILGVASLGIM